MTDDDEYEGRDDTTTTHWEDAAVEAVQCALESVDFDEVRGLVIVPDSSGDHRLATECRSIEELEAALVERHEEQWYANVPFDSGEAVFHGDPWGFVREAVAEHPVQQFFHELQPEPEDPRIIAASDLIDFSGSKVVRVDLEQINDELIAYLADHPEQMQNLEPRRFEELVARLFKDKGYDVELTPRTGDGGLDVIAIKRDELGAALTIIECKRFLPPHKVGVGIVRALYGVVEEKTATKGLIATTSYFTKGAKALHDKLKHRLSLADYDAMCRFLQDWRGRIRK